MRLLSLQLQVTVTVGRPGSEDPDDFTPAPAEESISLGGMGRPGFVVPADVTSTPAKESRSSDRVGRPGSEDEDFAIVPIASSQRRFTK